MRKLILNIALSYIDDIKIKGSKSKYNDEEVPEFSGVRRFMFEYLQNLDRVLAELECAGITISAEKSYFCLASIKIVGFVCDYKDRYPDQGKISKILFWPDYRNISDVRAFINICIYYRI